MNGSGAITLQGCIITAGTAVSIECPIYNFYSLEHESTSSSCQKLIADHTQKQNSRDLVHETKQLERLINSLILYFEDHPDLDGPSPGVLVEKLQEITHLTIPSIYKRYRRQIVASPIRGLKWQTYVKVQGIRSTLSTIQDDWEGTWEGNSRAVTPARELESLLGPVWHRFWCIIREPFPVDKVCRDISDLQGGIHLHLLRFDQILDNLPKKVKQIQIDIVDFFGNEWSVPQELCLHRDAFLSVLRYKYQDGPANAVVANRLFSVSQKENFRLIRREEWAQTVTSGDGLQLSVIISIPRADTKSTQSVKCPRCENWCCVEWTDLDDPEAEPAYCYKCDTSFTVRNSTLEDETFSESESTVDSRSSDPGTTLGNTDSDGAQCDLPIEGDAYLQSPSNFGSNTFSNNNEAKPSTSYAVDHAAFKYFFLRLTQEDQPEDLFEDLPPIGTRSPTPSDAGESIPTSMSEQGLSTTKDENASPLIQPPNASVDSQQPPPAIDPRSPTPSDVGETIPTSVPEQGLSAMEDENSSPLIQPPSASVDSRQDPPATDPRSPTSPNVGESIPTSVPELDLSTMKDEKSSSLIQASNASDPRQPENPPATDPRSPTPSDIGYIPTSVPELGLSTIKDEKLPNASVNPQQNPPSKKSRSPTPRVTETRYTPPRFTSGQGRFTMTNGSSGVLVEAAGAPLDFQQMIENTRRSLDLVFQMKNITTGRSKNKRLKDVVTECHGQPLKLMTVIVRSLTVARIMLEVSEEGSQFCDCLLELAESKCPQIQRSEEEKNRFIDEKTARIQELAGRLEQRTQQMYDEFRGFRLGIFNVQKDLTDLAKEGKEKGFLFAAVRQVFAREDPDAFVEMLSHIQTLISNILSNLGPFIDWWRDVVVKTQYLKKNANSNLVQELSIIHLRNVKRIFVGLRSYFKWYKEKMTELYDQHLGLLDMTSQSQISGAEADMARDLQNLNRSQFNLRALALVGPIPC